MIYCPVAIHLLLNLFHIFPLDISLLMGHYKSKELAINMSLTTRRMRNDTISNFSFEGFTRFGG